MRNTRIGFKDTKIHTCLFFCCCFFGLFLLFITLQNLESVLSWYLGYENPYLFLPCLCLRVSVIPVLLLLFCFVRGAILSFRLLRASCLEVTILMTKDASGRDFFIVYILLHSPGPSLQCNFIRQVFFFKSKLTQILAYFASFS
jgi:hypothetical protein